MFAVFKETLLPIFVCLLSIPDLNFCFVLFQYTGSVIFKNKMGDAAKVKV